MGFQSWIFEQNNIEGVNKIRVSHKKEPNWTKNLKTKCHHDRTSPPGPGIGVPTLVVKLIKLVIRKYAIWARTRIFVDIEKDASVHENWNKEICQYWKALIMEDASPCKFKQIKDKYIGLVNLQVLFHIWFDKWVVSLSGYTAHSVCPQAPHADQPVTTANSYSHKYTHWFRSGDSNSI